MLLLLQERQKPFTRTLCSKTKIEAKEKNRLPIIDQRPPLEVGIAVIHAAGILGIAVMIHGPPLVFLGDKFLHLPVALFSANAELEIFLRYRIPVLMPKFSESRNRVRRFVIHTL